MLWTYTTVDLIDSIDADAIISKIELATRNCYKSEGRIEEGSGAKLIRSCIKRGHESPLEHQSITFRVICDRAVSHELVRHRMASYSQESQRYCSYVKDQFGGEVTFVYPSWFVETLTHMCEGVVMSEDDEKLITSFDLIQDICEEAEKTYLCLLEHGVAPEYARAVLPNCTKTDVVCTMNIRELRHFLKLRGSKAAHPDIRKVAKSLLVALRKAGLGIFFEDIEVYEQDAQA